MACSAIWAGCTGGKCLCLVLSLAYFITFEITFEDTTYGDSLLGWGTKQLDILKYLCNIPTARNTRWLHGKGI